MDLTNRGEVSWECLKSDAAEGTAVASFCVQGFSVDGLVRASVGDLSKRTRELARMCSFQPPQF